MDGAVVGPYIFDVKIPSTNQHGGSIENIQLTVVVFAGRSVFSRFSIDVSGDLEVPSVTEPVLVSRSDPLNIPLELQVDQELLHMAILEQRNAREVSLPVELELPGPDWSRSYPKFVSTLHHKRAELESVEKALKLAGMLVNPILAALGESQH